MKKLSKNDRQHQLTIKLQENPFLSDGDLSGIFNVSIQTIRLDRLEQNIPELRERIRDVATQHHDEVKALPLDEVIGEIIELQLDKVAISLLEIKDEHVFHRNKIARGHFLFAQANSLCVALLDDELALTASSEVKFIKPVRLGDRVVTKALLKEKRNKRALIEVTSMVQQQLVFKGKFVMYYFGEGDES
ncbi:transcription factor FapR [Macrococcus hajekii]|uniref:Transcription factor FapR n=1 Tax=Macrococcus hajekii TaxID=198482 RepID=A0A4R6BN04_9STAP|nr:transcription factor FapR [Macrococcus hajekii]TDM03223.1 transcription factor FapR [Macrococcus hajekii]GGA97081.1 transcription factor FapR [Macrococcus hajekii]